MDSKLTDYAAVAQRIAAVPGVKSAIPLVEGQALASGAEHLERRPGARHPRAGPAQGVAASTTTSASARSTISTSRDGVAIGTRLATQLGLTIGDKLTLVAPRGSVTPMGVTPRINAYPVVAIFEIGMSEYDSTFVILPFSEAQVYFNLDDEASAVEIYLNNADDVDAMRPAIETGRRPAGAAHLLAAAQRRPSSRRSRWSGTSCS